VCCHDEDGTKLARSEQGRMTPQRDERYGISSCALSAWLDHYSYSVYSNLDFICELWFSYDHFAIREGLTVEPQEHPNKGGRHAGCRDDKNVCHAGIRFLFLLEATPLLRTF
jgi:hypothetical protein